MKKTTITCDGCNKNISESGSMPQYRLKLSCDSVELSAVNTFLVYVPKIIDEDKYFCGIECLKNYFNVK